MEFSINMLIDFTATLFEKIVAWSETTSDYAITNGFPLSESQFAIDSGIQNSGNIRIIMVTSLPRPSDPELLKLIDRYGFLGDNTAGLTLGYGIYLNSLLFSPRILYHELRHVYQYEQAGSIRSFLAEYIQQIMQYGYADSPFELDARRFEH